MLGVMENFEWWHFLIIGAVIFGYGYSIRTFKLCLTKRRSSKAVAVGSIVSMSFGIFMVLWSKKWASPNDPPIAHIVIFSVSIVPILLGGFSFYRWFSAKGS